jgi:hypothetical protein
MTIIQRLREKLAKAFEPVSRGTLSKREIFDRMHQGGTNKPFVLIQGIIDNQVTVVMPKKYTVPKGTNCLFAAHKDYPDHYVNINYIIEDGYTCLVDVRKCKKVIVDVRPGFDNEDVILEFKNPLLNKQASGHVLKKWDTE